MQPSKQAIVGTLAVLLIVAAGCGASQEGDDAVAASALANTAVTWSVLEAGGGLVDSTGLYTAPGSTGTFHVVATSVADPAISGSAVVTVGTAPPPPPVPVAADRITTWSPGIERDGQLGLPLGADGLPQRTTVCATLNPGGNIQAAITGCAPGQVVQLNAGTYSVSSTIVLTKGVVLRGAGSSGAPAGTTIVKTGGGTVIAVGTDGDSTCYGGTGYALTRDGAKESKTVSVGSAAGNFVAGDLALVDVVDDSTVRQGDCSYYKRISGRSVSQRVEIAGVDAASGTLTLSSPLHWGFRSASPYAGQITRVTRPTTRWAGVEHLRLQGGTNPGYNGEMAGGIDISNAAYCWVKDVQTDGTIGGMHVVLTGTYRCVVRDSYFHHSANYGFGTDCYGIVLRCGAADNLVENNIVRYMNKPILMQRFGWRQRDRLQLRRQLLGNPGRVAGGEHRLSLRVPAHGAHGGQLCPAHGRIDHARQRGLPHVFQELRVEPVRPSGGLWLDGHTDRQRDGARVR